MAVFPEIINVEVLIRHVVEKIFSKGIKKNSMLIKDFKSSENLINKLMFFSIFSTLLAMQ